MQQPAKRTSRAYCTSANSATGPWMHAITMRPTRSRAMSTLLLSALLSTPLQLSIFLANKERARDNGCVCEGLKKETLFPHALSHSVGHSFNTHNQERQKETKKVFCD